MSYMTKVDKSMITEFKSILQKCIIDQTNANIRILKLDNAFLNAQQMSTQLAIDEGLSALAPNFWQDHIKCHELNTVMRQNDLVFINILNRFRKATHTIDDIKIINDLCVKSLPIDSQILYLFYTNKDMMAHND